MGRTSKGPQHVVSGTQTVIWNSCSGVMTVVGHWRARYINQSWMSPVSMNLPCPFADPMAELADVTFLRTYAAIYIDLLVETERSIRGLDMLRRGGKRWWEIERLKVSSDALFTFGFFRRLWHWWADDPILRLALRNEYVTLRHSKTRDRSRICRVGTQWPQVSHHDLTIPNLTQK